MIAMLRGALVDKGIDRVLIDVGGVGYRVAVSLQHAGRAAARRQRRRRCTPQLIVREDALSLFGFATVEERAAFQLVHWRAGHRPQAGDVDPVDAATPSELARAVRDGDHARLRKIPGIGKKTAERLVLELRDKFDARRRRCVGGEAGAPWAARDGGLGAGQLGYKPAEAERAADRRGRRRTRGAGVAELVKRRCARSRSRVGRMRKKHDEGARRRRARRADARRAAGAPRLVDAALAEDDAALRPRSFDEYVGQQGRRQPEGLRRGGAAARRGARPRALLGPARPRQDHAGAPHRPRARRAAARRRRAGDRAQGHAGVATSRRFETRGVLFIDEVHRLQPVVEEYLYPAMEDFRLEIPVGDGPNAEMLPLSSCRASRWSGATTRTGLLSAPLLSRFGIVLRLDYYSAAELTEIVRRSAELLGVRIDAGGAEEIGRRARGTPRIANHLLRRVRDFAEVQGDGRVTPRRRRRARSRAWASTSSASTSSTARCCARSSRSSTAAPSASSRSPPRCAEERDTLEDVCEPYLIQEGFLMRTPRGRVATRRAHEHLGLPPPRQGSLL